MTDCNSCSFEFQRLGAREITARFDAPAITSDAGSLLLRELDERLGVLDRFADCFVDQRSPHLTVHPLRQLLAQRIFGLALGYEDLNDHEQLRDDPLFAVIAGRNPALTENNRLAGKSTLNRLELTPVGATKESRYKKVIARHDKIGDFFVDTFLQFHQNQPPKRIVLDVDATDIPLHGDQSGKFFHGYYKNYSYLPLYIFCGSHLLCAKLRPADIDAASGTVKQLARIITGIRAQWPDVEIVVRGDSGFCRESIMSWCETNQVGYLFGLAKNKRLLRILGRELHQAQEQFASTHKAARVFKDFSYRTKSSWSRERRVIGKAEHLSKGSNPRFVVTNLAAEEFDAQSLYEKEYCARGDMENRIKEQQLYLFANRTSASTMRANQLRLWLSSVAYVMVNALRQQALKGTELEKAQCQTIRLKLFKIGAAIRVTVRKVWISLSKSYAYPQIFQQVFDNLRAIPTPHPSPG